GEALLRCRRRDAGGLCAAITMSAAGPPRNANSAASGRSEAGTPPISRYPVPALAELPEDIRARILEVQEKAGFVPNVFSALALKGEDEAGLLPNVFATLAHRPDEFRAFFAYHDALMLREGGLTKAEREMIVVATSGANGWR